MIGGIGLGLAVSVAIGVRKILSLIERTGLTPSLWLCYAGSSNAERVSFPMLVKAGIAACVLACAAAVWSTIDFRQLYNEMYPVNGLRRDVLSLCHEVQPTFVRAIEADRVGCYDSMPDPVELAIGWVRTTSRLAAMHKPTPVEVAEHLLVAATQERRLDRLGPLHFTGYSMVTGGAAYACDEGKAAVSTSGKSDLALALPDDRMVLRLARGDRAAMAALGLEPVDRHSATSLPILSLGGAGGGSGSADASGATVGLADSPAAAGAGDDTVPPRAASAAPAICRTRA